MNRAVDVAIIVKQDFECIPELEVVVTWNLEGNSLNMHTPLIKTTIVDYANISSY